MNSAQSEALSCFVAGEVGGCCDQNVITAGGFKKPPDLLQLSAGADQFENRFVKQIWLNLRLLDLYCLKSASLLVAIRRAEFPFR
jgi:hypothetical protein